MDAGDRRVRAAADQLAQYATEKRFEKLSTPVRQQVISVKRDQLPAHAVHAHAPVVLGDGGQQSRRLNAIVAQDLPGPGSVFLEQHLRYVAPVRPGDTITGEVEVLSLREDKPIVRLAVRVDRQDAVRVLEGEATVYVMEPTG